MPVMFDEVNVHISPNLTKKRFLHSFRRPNSHLIHSTVLRWKQICFYTWELPPFFESPQVTSVPFANIAANAELVVAIVLPWRTICQMSNGCMPINVLLLLFWEDGCIVAWGSSQSAQTREMAVKHQIMLYYVQTNDVGCGMVPAAAFIIRSLCEMEQLFTEQRAAKRLKLQKTLDGKELWEVGIVCRSRWDCTIWQLRRVQIVTLPVLSGSV